jgi:cellulose synthase/poly-beta-1,6-N-acetylglucosamine synthase-like glycosyltransferase
LRTLKASVIVPVYNGSRTIDQCLLALVSQTLPRSQYEIIVVDDGSTDDTATLVTRYGVRVLYQPHRGPAAARNLGVASAQGEIVLFTDADVEPSHNWVETMLAPFASDSNLAGVKGTYRTRQREWMARFVQFEYEEKYARMAQAQTIDVIDTYSAAYCREVAQFDGGFDESFAAASAEDQEFSFRLAKAGYQLRFVPEAIVYHQHVTSLLAYSRRKFRMGYWRAHLHRRHPDKLVSDTYAPPTIRIQILLVPFIVGTLLAGFLVSWVWIASALFGVLFLFSAIPLTWRAFRDDPPVGLVAPGVMVCRAISLGVGFAFGIVAEFVRDSPLWRQVFSRLGIWKQRIHDSD